MYVCTIVHVLIDTVILTRVLQSPKPGALLRIPYLFAKDRFSEFLGHGEEQVAFNAIDHVFLIVGNDFLILCNKIIF